MSETRDRRVRRTISQRSELLNDWHDYGVNPDTREIFLMSCPENPEEGIEYCGASTFIKNLALLDSFSHKPILIRQNTVGGEWEYGMAIYDAILASPSKIVLLAYAHARSMSSIIPQAATKRVMMPNADFLIHFGEAGYIGDARSFAAEGRQADLLDARMIDLYAARCVKGPFFRRRKMSREKVREYLRHEMNERREWYMTPQQAVDFGFMDGIFGERGFRTIEEIRSI